MPKGLQGARQSITGLRFGLGAACRLGMPTLRMENRTALRQSCIVKKRNQIAAAKRCLETQHQAHAPKNTGELLVNDEKNSAESSKVVEKGHLGDSELPVQNVRAHKMSSSHGNSTISEMRHKKMAEIKLSLERELARVGLPPLMVLAAADVMLVEVIDMITGYEPGETQDGLENESEDVYFEGRGCNNSQVSECDGGHEEQQEHDSIIQPVRYSTPYSKAENSIVESCTAVEYKNWDTQGKAGDVIGQSSPHSPLPSSDHGSENLIFFESCQTTFSSEKYCSEEYDDPYSSDSVMYDENDMAVAAGWKSGNVENPRPDEAEHRADKPDEQHPTLENGKITKSEISDTLLNEEAVEFYPAYPEVQGPETSTPLVQESREDFIQEPAAADKCADTLGDGAGERSTTSVDASTEYDLLNEHTAMPGTEEVNVTMEKSEQDLLGPTFPPVGADPGNAYQNPPKCTSPANFSFDEEAWENLCDTIGFTTNEQMDDSNSSPEISIGSEYDLSSFTSIAEDSTAIRNREDYMKGTFTNILGDVENSVVLGSSSMGEMTPARLQEILSFDLLEQDGPDEEEELEGFVARPWAFQMEPSNLLTPGVHPEEIVGPSSSLEIGGGGSSTSSISEQDQLDLAGTLDTTNECPRQPQRAPLLLERVFKLAKGSPTTACSPATASTTTRDLVATLIATPIGTDELPLGPSPTSVPGCTGTTATTESQEGAAVDAVPQPNRGWFGGWVALAHRVARLRFGAADLGGLGGSYYGSSGFSPCV